MEDLKQLSYEEFKNIFTKNNRNYRFLAKLDDINYGISLDKPYSDEYLSLIHIYLDEKKQKNGNIPLIIHIQLCKLFLKDRYIVVENRKSNEPIDVIFYNDYFYSINRKSLINKKLNVMSAEKILAEAYSKHLLPTKKLMGVLFRTKSNIVHKIIPTIFFLLARLCRWSIFILFGYEYKFTMYEIVFGNKLTKKDEQKKDDKKKELVLWDIVKINPWLLTIIIIIHFFIFIVFYIANYKPDFIRYILEYNVLTVLYVIVVINIFNIIEYLLRKGYVFFKKVGFRIKSLNLRV